MVINLNNSHINSFTKGMNSDLAYDQIGNEQYTFGLNIRITKNQQLGGANDYSLLHEGIVTPVCVGKKLDTENVKNIYESVQNLKILSVDSVDNICTIVTGNNNSLIVYRAIIDNDEITSFRRIYKFDDFWEDGELHQLSTLLYRELENVIKLYISTGKYPIITLRIDDLYLSKTTNNENTNIDSFINDRITPNNRVYINDVISGRLPASLIQYTYRFYNKYGNTSHLAPITNKIQVIDSSRDKETGNAQETETSKGFQITIDVSDYKDIFDRMQVFRLTYIKPNENAEVSIIYDDKIKDNSGIFTLNDVGIEPLQSLTIEEFAGMSGLILIPQAIENNLNYMFCANIKDDTIIKDLTIEDSSYIDLVTTKVNLFSIKEDEAQIPQIPTLKFESDEYITSIENSSNLQKLSDYFESRSINSQLPVSTYNDIFTSSLLRSLRRGETYKYGIVYYDKYGRRSDVFSIGKKEVPEIDINSPKTLPFVLENTTIQNSVLVYKKFFALPIGVKINLPLPKDRITGELIDDIIGCQIVRRSSSEVYLKTLLQVALARPIRQGLALLNGDFSSENKSPFYPSGFLTTHDITIMPVYYSINDSDSILGATITMAAGWVVKDDNGYFVINPEIENGEKFYARTLNKNLFLIFSSEIDFRRDDTLEKLNVSNTKINELLVVSPLYKIYNSPVLSESGGEDRFNKVDENAKLFLFGESDTEDNRETFKFHREKSLGMSPSEKQDIYCVIDYLNISSPTSNSVSTIKSIKDVKIPNWSDGYINIQRSGDNNIIDAIKKYKSFTTTIDQNVYNNWVSFGKYDIKPGNSISVPNQKSTEAYTGEFLNDGQGLLDWLGTRNNKPVVDFIRCGTIGAGPSCFLIYTDTDFGTYPNVEELYTSICNITHSPKIEDVESDSLTIYYGFGNYFDLKKDNGRYKVVTGSDLNDYMIVFDGDIYITPHEFTTMYKTYNFESPDTLQSTQITNYIPLESKVNTYFDYGKNLLNTNSPNLIYEPGQIEGVITQERPAHQYNMVYSDNDASNDVFTLISTDKDETNEFRLRAYFSEPKANGEFIDNFLIFKPASFIDVDSKYGQITDILTEKNTLYYWQDHAFGKFSVNERSLINDQNGNTIMLGQAGVLSRYDYISTKYGMRLYDFCANTTENGVYWVDINNKAVLAADGNGAVNMGEALNVQNILNNKISNEVPKVHYDIQNNELLCKCLNDGQQLVFNTKMKAATSVYNRVYENIINIKNHIFGIDTTDEIEIVKYNYLPYNKQYEYLSPIILDFVVNANASITKVFDSLQIVPIKRLECMASVINNTQMQFETDLHNTSITAGESMYTDREGNIIYNIPRFGNLPYGNRLRGKWMKVDIKNENPNEYYTISHAITKFRQSFS